MKISCDNTEIISLESEEVASMSYDIDETVAIHELQLIMGQLLNTLTPREECVIRLRYFLGMTLREISEQIGVNHERVRQIEAKALRKLKHPSRSRKIRTYLAYKEHYLSDNDNYDMLESLYQQDCDLLNKIISCLLRNNQDICNRKYVFEDGSDGIIKASDYGYDILITPVNNNAGMYASYNYPFKVIKNTLNLKTLKIEFNRNKYKNDYQLSIVMNNIINKFIECCKKVGYIEMTNDYVILTKEKSQELYEEVFYN